jgi:3'(2'), 5'-bisphosphate nucleotidase
VITLPPEVDINELINDLRIFSWEASGILLNYAQIIKFSNNKTKILKNNNSQDPVTLADLKVNELIIRRIKEKYKSINWEILSEENVKLPSQTCNNEADWIWILDPLDGTKDFIQGTCNYAMHLALNYKKKPYLGVVLVPEKEELWISNGEKVWCEKKDGSKSSPSLSKNKSLRDMILVTSKNHRNDSLRKLIHKIEFKEVKVMGSIGCKISSLLRGESDMYVCLSLPGGSSPKDWDFAAPEAILRTAGGKITNLDNEDLIYGNSNFEHGGIIVASSDANLHEIRCLEIKEILEKFEIYPIKS